MEAFWQLIRGPEVRSPNWLEYVRDTIRGSIEMHDPDATEYTEEGASSLIHYGQSLSDADYSTSMLNFDNDQVVEWLDALRQDQAHAIVFRGSET